MNKLTNNELKTINGGAVSTGFWIILGGVGLLLLGILDGYRNPLKCNNG